MQIRLDCEAMSIDENMLDEMLVSLPGLSRTSLSVSSKGGLPSVFPTTEFATAAVSAAGLAAAQLAQVGPVIVDRRLASAWFASSLKPIGWDLPSLWDAVAGDYATRDGWIRLHTSAPHHRAAALGVLGSADSREAVAEAVSTWAGVALEHAVIAAGGCAAAMRSPNEWSQSAQGLAVAAEPLIAWRNLETAPDRRPSTSDGRLPSESNGRPLTGIRVLDLTRVLAGPVATRFLALLGADVLRIDPPDWQESVIPEVNLGKRTARLDLAADDGRATFIRLVAAADVIVHGYRPGALDRLGFGDDERRRIRPGLIDIALNAYGWSGPRRWDRGFDSLVQMSTGIAHAGMIDTGADRPAPLPVQALDHATGYLAAAATLTAIEHRRPDGTGISARLSLARTAHLLLTRRGDGDHAPFAPLTEGDYSLNREETSWGPANRLHVPLSIGGIDLRAGPAHELGHDQPSWEHS